MKITLDIDVTPAQVLARADSRYWYGQETYAPEPPTLTAKRLSDGLLLLPCLKYGAGGTIIGKLVSGDADGADYDVLLQLSLLGEVRYG